MADTVTLKLDNPGKGAFIIEEAGERLAEMVVGIDDRSITVFHTEVSPKLKGHGAGTELLNAMVDYARKHHLKVIALCPFVSAQFKRHEDLYGDVWLKNWR